MLAAFLLIPVCSIRRRLKRVRTIKTTEMETEYLFPNFLESPEEYNAARAYWRALCGHLLSSYDQSDVWEPRTEQPSADGTPERDGNPIYSLVNHNQLKSIVIIQQDPKIHRKWEIVAWVDKFGDEFSEPRPIDELVFACNLTHKAVNTFQRLFEAWIQPSCQVRDIEEMIEALIPMAESS